MNRGEWGRRVVALVLAAAAVVAVVGAGAVYTGGMDRPGGGGGPGTLDTSEYAPANVNPDVIAERGEIRVDRAETTEGGTVMIDAAHGNRFSRSTVQPMVEALTRVGYDVEFYTGGDLAAELKDAKAFVVIDPATEYKPGDVDDIRRFTGQGGHLLVVGEPDRITVGGLLGASLQTQGSRLTTLTTPYGMSVDTAYLYNQEDADGNYKFLTTNATPQLDRTGVNRTTMYTAAAVNVRGGRVLLRSAPRTFKSSTDDQSGRYPVAVRKTEVVAVGDKGFLGEENYRVADNEAFVAYLVEFLASSDREQGEEVTAGDDADPAEEPEFPLSLDNVTAEAPTSA